jgi:hypothetical protein
MSADSITPDSTGETYTLVPLLAFILTYKEDRTVDVPVLRP